MVSHYKNKDLLKIHSFYSSEIENNKKKKKKTKNISRLLSSSKKLPTLIYLNSFHFFHKEEKT